MKLTIPSAADVRAQLEPLTHSQIQALADRSGVPFHTILKIRSGETKNPGVDTVNKFATFIEALSTATERKQKEVG